MGKPLSGAVGPQLGWTPHCGSHFAITCCGDLSILDPAVLDLRDRATHRNGIYSSKDFNDYGNDTPACWGRADGLACVSSDSQCSRNASVANAPMRIKTIHERARYVEAVLDGTFSTKHLAEIRKDLERAATMKKAARLLINGLPVTGPPPSTLERYEFVQVLVGLPRSLKIAAAIPPELIDPARFGETVARNRGVVVRAFDDLEQSLKWLLSKKEDPFPAKPKRP